MTAHALLFTLAAIGISEAVYLLRKTLARQRPVCVIGSRCHLVLESKYNRIFGIPNEVVGLVFYVAIALITAFLVIEIGAIAWWDSLAKILIFAGVVMSVYFIYLQWVVIKAWCFWCVMSACTIFLMAFIVLTSDLAFVL